MTDDQLLYAAYLKKIESKPLPFPAQDAFINDKSPFLAAQCTRRAGKTNGLAMRLYNTMCKHPGTLSRYIALTHGSAEDILWPVLQQMDEIYSWNAKFNVADLSMTIPNGAKLKLIGADTKNFIKRLKGAKSPAIAIDEAQDFGPHLQSLIDDVLTPTMADYDDAWLAITGTPGLIPSGTFFDITNSTIGGYSVHKWSIFDNPYLPNAKKFVEDLKLRNKWEDDNPSYMREWLNKWVLDLDSLLIKYNAQVNHYEEIPKDLHLSYILGVDIGMRDADALAVLGWSEQTHDIYLVEELITNGQDITELSTQIEYMMRRYDLQKIIMDEGALGKKIAEEIRRRKRIPVQAADKARKMENVAFLNDWLRLGRFKAKKNSRFATDSTMVQIDWEKTTPDRLVVKDSFHSDIIDSVLYAFKESPAFTYEKAKQNPVKDTKEYDEYFAQEMFEHNFKRIKQEKEAKDGNGMNWVVNDRAEPSWTSWE